MNVFLIYPPSIPLYFNAGYHLDLWILKSYLEKKLEKKIRCKDAALLNQTWSDVLRDISGDYDVYVIQNEFDNYGAVKTIVNLIREISPKSKIVTFGKLSYSNQDIFKKLDLDCVVYSGDFEKSISNYLEYLRSSYSLPEGTKYKINQTWKDGGKGQLLKPSEIVFPNVKEVPYNDYNNLYSIKSRKFPGVPNKKELIIPVSRGCPNSCPFCLVPKIQGLKERRKSIKEVLYYLKYSMKKADFDYVNFYSPHFTIDRKWVVGLCRDMENMAIRWKCCTSVNQVDEDLIRSMARAGCFRISFGIETLSKKLQKKYLSKNKICSIEDVKKVYESCKKNGIEVNWLVMTGFPDESRQDLVKTINTLKSIGGEIRPTVYTDYSQISGDFDEKDLLFFNRKIAVKSMHKNLINQLIHDE